MNKNIDIKDYYYSNCGEDIIYSKYVFDNVNNSKTIANEIKLAFNLKEKEGLFLKEDACHDKYISDDQFNNCYEEIVY